MSRLVWFLVALLMLPRVAFTDTPEGLDADVSSGVYREITSLAVARDGVIQLERYWNGADAASFHDTRSATKTLVSLAVGKAIADGKIPGVATPAMNFFAAERPFRFQSATKDAISIRDLLTMSSALGCDDNNWDSPGNEGRMYPARRWLFFVLDLHTEDAYSRDANGYGRFAYCTAGSFLLGQLVERAVGQAFDVYFRQSFELPLGIKEVRWDRSPSGEVQTGGGAEMTTRDLLKIGELIRNRGAYGDEKIIPASWIREMTEPHVVANEEQRYGYQIWARDFCLW